ncbi:MAG: Uma2 family endonuclease [Deltaproteobacteria bacterium]|nr:Uma2 family endonuclease [Deltaproteobacteria bacterium]
MPDVQVYRKGRNVPNAGLTDGAPDLAIEVISPGRGRYDRVLKLNWYRDVGTPEYWIVDPEDRSVQVLELRDGAYVVAQGAGLAASDDEATEMSSTLRPARWEGLEIDLARLFSELTADEGEVAAGTAEADQ